LARLKETEDFKTLEKIAHYSTQIETPKVNVTEALAALKLKTQNTSKKGKGIQFNFQSLYKYAAAVVILCTTSYFLLFNNTSNVKTTFAQTKNFSLPDASKVILNANSAISYDAESWENSRNLTLKGEAYFKVEKGKKFTVNTVIGKVTVLGTQFNVKERVDYFEVKTYEGLVRVAYKDTLVQLPKGTLFKVVNGKIATTNTFDVNEKSWLQKESNFKSTSLRFVLEEIEHQFGYKIETGTIDLNVLFTGGFAHTDINIALQSVTIPLQLSYKIVGKKITVFNYGK
jgi:ferric-dicitrate binding protein FerR (iron transport regulator)